MVNNKDKRLEAFGRLLDVMDELRVKCPWDRVQTFESLRSSTIERRMNWWMLCLITI
jgi:XTP/dITP diphosphohydrolase